MIWKKKNVKVCDTRKKSEGEGFGVTYKVRHQRLVAARLQRVLDHREVVAGAGALGSRQLWGGVGGRQRTGLCSVGKS